MFKRSLIASSLISLAALTSVPAAAETVAVNSSAYNLSTEAGRSALDAELRIAVREICGSIEDYRIQRQVRNYRKCVADTKQSFAEQRRGAIARAQGAAEPRMAVSSRTANEG